MTEHSSTRVISYLCGPTDDHYTVRWPTGPSKSEVRIPSRRAWTPPATVAARRATPTYRYIGTALLLHVAACRSPVETSPRGLERFFWPRALSRNQRRVPDERFGRRSDRTFETFFLFRGPIDHRTVNW